MTFAATTQTTPNILPPAMLERARGHARASVRADRGVMRLREGYQSGSAKLRFPRAAGALPLEVVLLNTAGGVTGGDVLSYAITVEAGAHGIATTQAAERVYRRTTGVARIETTLSVEAGGTLDWIPQETILFDRSALRRTLDADVHPDGRLLAVEAVVLGRIAMGETVRDIALMDSWRIRRGRKLAFAEGLHIDGDAVEIMSSGTTGNGAAALATLVLVARDAETHLDAAREALRTAAGEAGASVWNGMLVARLIAPTGQVLRADLIRLVETLRGAPMPRVWSC